MGASPSLGCLAQQAAGLEAVVATPTMELVSATTSFAAVTASTPSSRLLPAEPRTRSSSIKRGSDGERSDSLKRQKTENELDLAIKRNRELLIEAGMDANKQNNLWKGLNGVQLITRQKAMIQKYCSIPNSNLAKKGGAK